MNVEHPDIMWLLALSDLIDLDDGDRVMSAAASALAILARGSGKAAQRAAELYTAHFPDDPAGRFTRTARVAAGEV